MADDIERYLNKKVPVRRDHVYRIPPPPWLTKAGQLDRVHEGQHLVGMRDVARRLERHAAETYAKLQAELQTLGAEDQLLFETKLSIQRQHRLSQVLADDDPELKAKYAVLDDDAFKSRRTRLLFGFDDD